MGTDFRLGDWVIRPDRGSIERGGEVFHLKPKAMAVLECLANADGQVAKRDELFDRVWPGAIVSDAALSQCVVELRHAFGDSARRPTIIETIPKVGFRLIPPARGLNGPIPSGTSGERQRPGPQTNGSTGTGKRISLVAGVAVLLFLLLSTVQWWSSTFRDGASPVRSLAVLPFKDDSASVGEGHFAAGMTEALITELNRVGTLKVISRTSAMQYANTTKSLPEIAADLGVDAVVEGSVQRAGSRVRVTAHLIKARTDSYVWTDSFDSELADILALQREVARSIVQGIGANLGSRPVPKTSLRPVNPEAYDAFLKAQMMQLEAKENAESVIKSAERVIELDPGFAPGFAYASDLYGFLALTTNVPDGDAYLNARRYAHEAVELDPHLAYARMALARVYFQFEWNWTAAQSEFERSLQLNPNDSQTLASYGMFQVLVYKDCARGIGLLETARNLDPFNPTMHFDLGVYNFHCRHHDESIRHLQRTGEMTPAFHYPRMMIAWNLSLQDQHELASAGCEGLVKELGATFDQILTGSCAWVYARSGQKNKAQTLLNSLLNAPAETRVDPVAISWACVGLDLRNCALDQLEKALQQRSSLMIYMQVAPAWDPVRDHPRFQSILERMDLPPEQH